MLVLTELHPNPEGANTGKQWFEVYNTGATDLDLRGLKIYFETAPGGRPTQRRHTIAGPAPVILAAGAHGTFSDGTETPGLVWSYGHALGSMPAAGLGVRLMCDGEVEIDSICFGAPCGLEFEQSPARDVVAYSEGDGAESREIATGNTTADRAPFEFPEGSSLALGARAETPPSPVDSSDLRNWRAATPTPGAPNHWAYDCPRPPEGSHPVPPAAGMIHVTEVFANPPEGGKRAEWLEFYLEADGFVDFKGVRVTTNEPTDPDSPAPGGGHLWSPLHGCTLLEGGRYHVMAGKQALDVAPAERSASSPWPKVGGARVVQSLTKVSLANTDGEVFFWYAGQRMAEARFGSSLEGRSRERVFSPGAPLDEPQWCDSAWPYRGGGDWSHRGTPGRENTPCGSHFCARPGEDGEPEVVAVEPPAPGELVITEVMSNAPAVDGRKDSHHEWFEAHLLATTTGPRHLAGLRMQRRRNERTRPLYDPEFLCRTAQPGDWLLFAFSDDPELNGGLPRPHGVFELPYGGFTMDDGFLALFTPDGTLLDQVNSYGRTTEGVATQLSSAVLNYDTPHEWNDEPRFVIENREGDTQAVQAWCPALSSYGPHAARGTPGAPNLPCDRCHCYHEERERWIEVVPPEPGEVRFSEIFANAPGPACRKYEWIELVANLDPEDSERHLNCAALVINDPSPTSAAVATSRLLGAGRESCVVIAPGQDPLVVCADEEGADRTGVGPCLPGLRDNLLVSAGSLVALVVPRDGEENVLVDEVEYGPVPDGRAWMLPLGDMALGDEAWCPVPDDYLYGEYAGKRFYGTPGAHNPSCVGGEAR